MLKLNLLAGCILPTKHVAKYWIDNKIKGAVINIASMSSYNPLSGTWAYSAAKAGVMNQTMGHAKELAGYGGTDSVNGFQSIFHDNIFDFNFNKRI